MSAARVLDDLARALAEPMPRRRALRMLGASLAAVAFPGLGPRVARAARGAAGYKCNPGVETCCGPDQRVCQKDAPTPLNKGYCCPSPSWRWWCGSKSNGYRCEDRCPPGDLTFPCTATIPHPQSGINGVCCDRRYHSGCEPVGTTQPQCCIPGKPGKLATCKPLPRAQCTGKGALWAPAAPWKPSCTFCAGKVCGPRPDTARAEPSRWQCCTPPNVCRKGVCRCPNGEESCGSGKKCCVRGEQCEVCFSTGTRTYNESSEVINEWSLVGRKCCRPGFKGCCGSTCCKEFGCCGTKCCPNSTGRCARFRGQKVCCPFKRLEGTGSEWLCCPPGTVGRIFAQGVIRIGPFPSCCPPFRLNCCDGVNCRVGEICVGGTCVSS